jgi:hypothetical protein
MNGLRPLAGRVKLVRVSSHLMSAIQTCTLKGDSMVTDMEEPTVVFVSEMVPNGDEHTEHIKFTLDLLRTTVSGASVSTTELIFSPGTYIVRVHLPPRFSGEGGITWVDDGMPIQPPPAPTGASGHGETWVQFGVLNESESGSFPFELSSGGTASIFRFGPTVVSDPPPTIELRSS